MLEALQLETLWFERDGVRLHATAAGPKNGRLVILLHGFPEFWYSWHRQIGPLANAGYRVVVPDQRGYNLSSKPTDVRSYSLTESTADVLAIADQLAVEQFCVAGHDWGGAVAWLLAMNHAERLHRVAVVNMPHLVAMLRRVRTDPRQMARSWYMGLFQLPWLPEAISTTDDFALLIRGLAKSSLPGTFSEEDFSRYRAAWSQPGALTAMIHWYRAAARFQPRISDVRVHVPIQILWGKRDQFVLPDVAEDSLGYCDAGQITWFPENTHWLQHEQPQAVADSLINFFRS